MVGSPIWDYTHQCDHTELRDVLHTSQPDPATANKQSDEVNCNALIRIKCTLTSRGRSVNIKSASYKVQIGISSNEILNISSIFFYLF